MRILGEFSTTCAECGDTWTATNPNADLWCVLARQHYEFHAESDAAALASVDAVCDSYRRALLLAAIEAGTLVRDDLTPLTHQEADALRFAVIGES